MKAQIDQQATTRLDSGNGNILVAVGKSALLALMLTLYIFSVNALWYAVLMKGFYENSQGSWGQVARDNPSIPIVVLSMFSVAFLMTLLFRRIRVSQRNRVLSYLSYGITVGLIYVLPASLYYFGTTDILAFNVVAMDVVWHVIEEGSAGILLGVLCQLPFFAALRGKP